MDHVWVKMTITPLEVLEDENGMPSAFADPDACAIAEQNAQFGCHICDQPLETAFGTECKGAS